MYANYQLGIVGTSEMTRMTIAPGPSERQYVIDRYGYLGKGNRKVCPSCAVKVIRQHYPSQTGVYMGFRED